ncbi:neuropeptides capa receptor-like [Asterias amurensis]|uniref:neuropeptides capa receptor-like n=1 Tax=Asterias amurensis TaxID=7602 RepID=UPI003AB39BD7
MNVSNVISPGPMEYQRNITPYQLDHNYSDYYEYHNMPDFDDLYTIESLSYHPSELIIITCIMPTILCLGLIGNLAFLFVVFRVRWMRTVVNFYLINLAAADILFLCAAIGEKIGMYVNNPIMYDESSKGKVGCIIMAFVKGWCYYTSITLVTLVSVGRFYAVCKPHDFKLNSKQRALKLISATWLVCCILGALVIPSKSMAKKMYYYPELDPNEDFIEFINNPRYVETCMPTSGINWIAYVTDGAQALPFLIAMSGNIKIYVSIYRALNDRVTKTTRQNSRERKTEMRDRVSRMLIANGTIFFLCLAPFEITSLSEMIMRKGLGDSTTRRTWTQFCRVMMYLNSAVNPVIYNITNPRYRQAFLRAFSRKQDRRNESKSPSTVQLSHLRGESQESRVKKDGSH